MGDRLVATSPDGVSRSMMPSRSNVAVQWQRSHVEIELNPILDENSSRRKE
jgi:hypothetical protein